jgi:serpin B
MPKISGMASFEENLTTEVINGIIGSLNTDRVMLSLPKFKYSSASLDLGQILKAMGMQEPFNMEADFSGITGAKNLNINNIIHKALIDVNEKGTKAAAVTVIGVGATCMPDEINVNRPFIFIIRDITTHAILFMGRVSKP